jgi:hypothetical protein
MSVEIDNNVSLALRDQSWAELRSSESQLDVIVRKMGMGRALDFEERSLVHQCLLMTIGELVMRKEGLVT